MRYQAKSIFRLFLFLAVVILYLNRGNIAYGIKKGAEGLREDAIKQIVSGDEALKKEFKQHQKEQAQIPEKAEKVTLIRVVDGDTLLVKRDGKEERVRLIGVDTPESVNPDESKNTEEGKVASDFTKSLMKGVSSVYLEYDTTERDQYERVLAYVYFEKGADTYMLNEYLLREGMAQVMTVPPNVKYEARFLKLQKKAQDNEVGFWAEPEEE